MSETKQVNLFYIRESTTKWRNGPAGTKAAKGRAFYIEWRDKTIGPFRSYDSAVEYAKDNCVDTLSDLCQAIQDETHMLEQLHHPYNHDYESDEEKCAICKMVVHHRELIEKVRHE